MLTIPLDPTDDRASPIYKNAASCAAWLAQFQLTNLQQAHSQLLVQLIEFNRYPMQGLERFHTLEVLRETIAHIQEDMAKKLVAKALPLNDLEMMVFVAITQLWQAMVTGYQRCLQAYLAGDKKLADMGAILCERCLQYNGLGIFEHLRVGYECNPKLWYQLHDLYAFAEEQAFHGIEVSDALNPDGVSSSCLSIYVKTLLSCYARPAELSRTQLKLLNRWLLDWSKEIRVETRYSLSKGDAQPLEIDLASTQGLRTLTKSNSDTMRYMAMVPMSKLLRVKIILLQQGATLDQVELGELPSNSEAIKLLSFLHECWCEENRDRLAGRDMMSTPAQFAYTPEMIFAALQGKSIESAFKLNAENIKRKQNENFGSVTLPKQKTLADQTMMRDDWVMENEGILGARLVRQNRAPGRLNLHQLVLVQRDAKQPPKMGEVAWLHVSAGGKLELGVSYVPGTPEPVHVQALLSARQIAFLLPEVSTLHSPSSLMLPRNVYKAGGILQITYANGELRSAKMGISVTRGFDYERISFTLI